jgi:hypothetical protein
MAHPTAPPIALLLAPRTVERFILYDQGQDLLRAPGVVGVDAPRVPYGVLGRLPDWLGDALAAAQARRVRLVGEPVVAMMFHPFQLPFARAVVARWPGCELWYGLFDRTPAAPDAGARTRRRLEELHAEASERADLVFGVSTTLVELERAAGRDAILMPSAADSFPAPDPEAAVIAVCFGTNGRRTDWKLLREVGEAMGDELVVLFVGALNEDECRDDPDFQACRELPQFIWLGRRSNDEAARLIMTADIGLLPYRRDDFNDAGLPNRILKAARVGRRTISADYDGVRVWERAIVRCRDAGEWVAALRASKGARAAPDMELRDWALGQTGERQDAPLWRRLARLGVAIPPGAGVEAGPPEDRRPEVAGRTDDIDAGGSDPLSRLD